MKIIISAKSAAAKAGVLVTPVFSDALDAPHLREADSKSGGRIAALRAIGEGSGSRYSCTLTSAGRLPADHLLLVGAGARADFGRQELQRWASAATRRLAGRKVTRLAIDATGIINFFDCHLLHFFQGGFRDGHGSTQGVEDSNFHFTVKVAATAATATGRERQSYDTCGGTGSETPGKTRNHVRRRSRRKVPRVTRLPQSTEHSPKDL